MKTYKNCDCVARVDYDSLTITIYGKHGRKQYKFNRQSSIDYFIEHNGFELCEDNEND